LQRKIKTKDQDLESTKELLSRAKADHDSNDCNLKQKLENALSSKKEVEMRLDKFQQDLRQKDKDHELYVMKIKNEHDHAIDSHK